MTLERDIAELLTRPVGRPSHKPVIWYKSFLYQAASWKTARRVVAKVEFHFGELFPRVGFIVTNLETDSRAVVRFYNKRGTAEQWIKEGKQAVKMTRLSCHRFHRSANMKVESVRCRFAIVFSFAALGLLTGLATAQEYRGRVQGMVTDPTRAAVVSARVILTNTGTGVESTRQTDPTGHYLFDFVQPGMYGVAVEAAGFKRFLQENVTVLTRGDVTVDAQLSIGDVTQNISVSEEISQVQFNTSTMTTTVQGPMMSDLPVEARNPYTLALLNAAVVNRYWDVAHRNPFYMWSPGGVDIGGPTDGRNEVQLDGTSLLAGDETSYTPPMDAVQEVVVQQNAIDAEFGFTAGGTLSLSTKSGTKDFHGTIHYFGRNPAANALANRITRDENIIRQSIWGGTLGHPIIKNKVFNFFAYEQWMNTQPSSNVSTVPTAAERNGDFSRTLTPDGTLRVIYDPWSTRFDPATSAVTRTPFTDNVIPGDRMDPAGAIAVGNMWKPNNAGDDLSGVNNFKLTYPWWTHYWNMTERVDYNVSDKLRMFGRFSKFQTRLDNNNWGETIAVPSDNGGIMDALNAEADILYVMNPRTTINVRFGSSYMEDDYASEWAQVPASVWAGFWPNGWYKPVLAAVAEQGVYYPSLTFNGNGSAPGTWGEWWYVHERVHSSSVSLTHDRGIHHMKAGWQFRYLFNHDNQHSGAGGFAFDSIDTGSTFLSDYDATQSGDMYASALLGVVNSGNAHIAPILDTHAQQWSLYFQDDVRLTRNITLNLGLRWERQTAPLEEKRMLAGGSGNQTLTVNTPIPELVSMWNNGQLRMPSEVTAVAQIPYRFNGGIVFTSNSNPRMFDAPWANFMPRAGIAIRLNDKTALRVGYARYMVPLVDLYSQTSVLPTNGFSQTTEILGPLQGMPRTVLSNPFPSANPLLLPAGNSLGAYTDLGNPIPYIWDGSVFKAAMNDRFNFTIQRQAPQQIFVDATFFMMLSHDLAGQAYNLNQMDPNLAYTYKGLVDQAVSNPFYNLLPANKMPGALRSSPTVPARQLLVPYPHYGALTEYGWPGGRDHYYALQLQAQRPMRHGLTFLVAYNYNQESRTQYFNALDQYNNKRTMLDALNPRHNFRIAGTWQLPFGRGRQYLNHVHPVIDAALGGWATSHIFRWQSGQLLRFNQAMVSGDPRQNVPPGMYFNPAVFKVAPAYSLRTNPWYYDGLRGPGPWQLDSTLVKSFKLTPERLKLEFRMEFYNLPNVFMRSNPVTTIGAGTMGRSVWVFSGNYGRELQYSARIRF